MAIPATRLYNISELKKIKVVTKVYLELNPLNPVKQEFYVQEFDFHPELSDEVFAVFKQERHSMFIDSKTKLTKTWNVYYEYWRCWTEKPSEQLMKQTEWTKPVSEMTATFPTKLAEDEDEDEEENENEDEDIGAMIRRKLFALLESTVNSKKVDEDTEKKSDVDKEVKKEETKKAEEKPYCNKHLMTKDQIGYLQKFTPFYLDFKDDDGDNPYQRVLRQNGVFLVEKIWYPFVYKVADNKNSIIVRDYELGMEHVLDYSDYGQTWRAFTNESTEDERFDELW